MDPIIVDDAMSDKLMDAEGPVPVRDADGQLLGHFIPAPPPEVIIELDPMPSKEELFRRIRESPSFTIEQIVERFNQLRGKRHAG